MSGSVGDGARRGHPSAPQAGGRGSARRTLSAGERRDLFLRYANDIILLLDEEFRLVDCNDRAVEAYGYSRQELLTKSVGDLRAQQPRVTLDERIAAIRATGSAVFESENLRKDGSAFPVETSVRMVETPKGLFYHTTVRDISERRTADADLQRTIGLLSRAEQEARIGHWEWDRETGALELSPALLRLCGVDPASHAPGADVRRVVHRDDREQRDRVLAAVTRGEPVTFAYRIVLPSGEVRYLEGSGDPQFDDAGELTGAFGVTQDVTARVTSTIALSESEERHRLLFAGMLEGFAYCRMLYDEQGRPDDFVYLSVNPAFARLTGIEDAAGRRVTEVLPTIKEQNPELLDIYARVAETGEPAEFDIDFAPLDRWLHVSATCPRRGEFVAAFYDVSERVRAVTSAKDNAERLRLSLAAAGAGTWEWDLINDENTWSDELWGLYGLDRETDEASYAAWLESVRPEDRAEVEGHLSKAVSGGKELDFEWRVNTRDGSVRWLLAHGSPEVDAAGTVLGYRGVVVDVTRRHEAESSFRKTLESIGDGFVSMDADWNIVYVNAAAERLLDLRREAVVGGSFWDALEGALGTKLEDGYRRAAAGEIVSFDYLYEPMGRWLHNRCFPREGGGMTAYVSDITERKASEAAILEREQNYAAIFLRSPFAIALSRTPENIIVDVNEAFLDLIERERDEVVGRTSVDLGIADADSRQRVADEFSVRGFVRDLEVSRTTLSGEERLVSLSVTPVSIAGQEHVLTTVRDVTEERRAEQQLLESRAKLDAAMASMTDGVYISDADGNLVDFNEAYARVNRFASKEECLRTYMDYPDLFEVYLGTGEPASLDQWAVPRALRGEVVVDAEYGVRRRDTGDHWIGSYSFGPIRDDAGEITGSVVVARDISDRKRAERDLQESEERHRRLFENMAQGVVYQLADGTIASANPAAERILGVTVDQLQGRTSMDPRWQAVREDGSDFPGEEHPAAVALRTGHPVHDVIMGVFHPGEEAYRWLSVDAVPEFRPGEDEPFRVFATFADITSRRHVEEALRGSEAAARETVARLSRAQQLGRMGDWEWDVASGSVLWADEIRRIYGVGPDFATSFETITPMTHPDDAESNLREAQAILHDRGRSSAALAFRIVRPDGAVRHIFQTLAVDRTVEGEPTRVFGIMQDVTELREAEQALLDSERRFRRFYDAGLIGVAFWTAEGAITDANDRFLHMLGYTREDLDAGEVDWAAMTPPQCAARDEESLKELRATGRNAVPFEKEYCRKDGGLLPVLVTGAALDEAATSGVVLVVDLSEQKRAEEGLRRLNLELEDRVRRRTADLEAANKELESFSYSVSHDLRAPLRHIAGFAELLRGSVRDHDDEDTGHFIDVITRSANEMGILIDDLLQFSRVGRAEMYVAPVDMEQLVREVLDVVASDLGDRRVEVAVGHVAPATGDRTLLRQVWANLIGNAYKYTRPRDPAVIEIGSRRDDGAIVYWVRDNGVGFDVQYAARLFHVFERLHRSDEFEGTGIGLANVQRIVGRHDGRCWAEAEEGKGATFFFSLPNG